MRSSGDSYGEAATEGSAGLIATSVSNDDRDGHNHGSGNRDGSHPMKPRRSLRSARATTIPAAPPSQAVLEEYNILHVEYVILYFFGAVLTLSLFSKLRTWTKLSTPNFKIPCWLQATPVCRISSASVLYIFVYHINLLFPPSVQCQGRTG
jgi:hypothetical protein